MNFLLTNGKIITPFRILEQHFIVIQDGKIETILLDSKENRQNYLEYEVIDSKNNYISPGFIDIHVHGGGGFDFMDGDVESFLRAAYTHMEYGTTSMVPTTLTSNDENLYKTLENFEKAKNESLGPNLLGLHLEGPYFSYEQRGAQDPKYLKNPKKEDYLKILEKSNGNIIRWSVAPELNGAMKMGEILSNKGILVSAAHSDATYEQILEACENGYKLLTHFYSGMSTIRRINAYRHAGVVESGYLIDEMNLEIIADGDHLPQSLLKLICKGKSSDKICLVTDAMRAAGCPEGEYILGDLVTGQKVIVEDGIAKTLDKKSFAGSVATADRLIRVMTKVAGCSIDVAVKMMTLNPARMLNIHNKKGVISPGKDADIIIFDENISIKFVMIGGSIKINKLRK